MGKKRMFVWTMWPWCWCYQLRSPGRGRFHVHTNLIGGKVRQVYYGPSDNEDSALYEVSPDKVDAVMNAKTPMEAMAIIRR